MPPLLQKAGLLSDEVGLHIETLTVLLLKKYGPVFIEWEPETLYEKLVADFGPVGVVAEDRIGAAQVLSAHDAAWQEWDVFENVVAAIQGVPAIFGQIQPPEVEFAAIGVNVLQTFAGHAFHDDVLGYIAGVCVNDGVWYVEAPLDIVAGRLAEFYDKRGFSPPTAELAKLLKSTVDYKLDPASAIDTQRNRVLSIRKALAEHRQQVEEQRRRLQ